MKTQWVKIDKNAYVDLRQITCIGMKRNGYYSEPFLRMKDGRVAWVTPEVRNRIVTLLDPVDLTKRG